MADNKYDTLELISEENENKEIERTLRNGFIRKVYGTIFFQLLITTLIVYYVMTNQSLMNFMFIHTNLIFVPLIFSIGIMLVLICSKASQKVPLNYILLIVFTICEGFTISFTTIYFEPLSVLACAGLTMIIVLGLSLYACFTKRDMTMMGGFLLSFSLILLFLGIIGIFFRSYFYQMLLDSLGVLLMSLYLIYDTQLVVGQKKEFIKLDLYILGAMMIYLDIINIFLKILRLFGTKKK